MATGLLIRDFSKDYRELRYANSGSMRFSEIEHNAYRLALTLEITHTDAPRYGNKKTLPDNTHYGYCTLFKGSTVTNSISIKYPKFRVFDIINDGIWQYHQHSESLQLLAGGVQELVNEQSSYFVATPGFVTFDTCKTLRFLFPPGADPVADLVLRLADCGDALAGDGERDLATGYRAFPIASPFPDAAKFKADIPLSFLWRLEIWYLVNPAVYIADNPTDTSDETGDEDEYPVPDQGDGDGDGSEFPSGSDPDPDSDPRDYNGGDDIEVSFGATLSWQVSVDNSSAYVNQTLESGPYGYPGGLSCRSGGSYSASVYYAWDGGEVLVSGTNYPPLKIKNFQVRDGAGNQLYTVIGETVCN